MEITEYERLLEIYIESLNKLKGLKLSRPEEMQFLDGLVKKLLTHSFAILDLVHKPKVSLSSRKYTFSDFYSPSILVISRAMIETYSVLYHTIFNLKSTHRELAQTFFALDSLKRRIKFAVYGNENIQRQKAEIRRVAQLETKLDNLETTHGKFPIKVIKQLELAGLGQQTIYEMYNMFSNYAHGGYVSALQVSQSDTESLKKFSRLGLTWGGIALSLTIIGIGRRFPQVRKNLEQQPDNAALVLMCFGLSWGREFGERKGIFENTKTGKYHLLTWIWDVSQGTSSHLIQNHAFKNKREALKDMASIQYKEDYLEYPPEHLIQKISWL